ncbi:hypothetical protein KJ810_04280 [Patescibacteria group bacterium]|nr:hypothetical protein [Patescibacteria group bacterium]
MRLPKHSITYWIITVVILSAVTVITTLFYRYYFDRFDINHVSENTSFQFSDKLVCSVIYSTYKNIYESHFKFLEEPTFMLSELDSDSPTLEYFGWKYTLEKTQESESTITYRVIPTEGYGEDSVEVIQIMKKEGIFVRTFMGQWTYFGGREAFERGGFQYVVAQKGRCE